MNSKNLCGSRMTRILSGLWKQVDACLFIPFSFQYPWCRSEVVLSSNGVTLSSQLYYLEENKYMHVQLFLLFLFLFRGFENVVRPTQHNAAQSLKLQTRMKTPEKPEQKNHSFTHPTILSNVAQTQIKFNATSRPSLRASYPSHQSHPLPLYSHFSPLVSRPNSMSAAPLSPIAMLTLWRAFGTRDSSRQSTHRMLFCVLAEQKSYAIVCLLQRWTLDGRLRHGSWVCCCGSRAEVLRFLQ